MKVSVDWLQEHGDKLELWQIASTHFGHPVYAILIGDSTKTSKPSVVHTFAVHGNELIGPTTDWTPLEYLLKNRRCTRGFAARFQSFGLSRWSILMGCGSQCVVRMQVPMAKNGRNTDGTCEPYAYEGVDISTNFPLIHSTDEPTELESETIALMNYSLEETPFHCYLFMRVGMVGIHQT